MQDVFPFFFCLNIDLNIFVFIWSTTVTLVFCVLHRSKDAREMVLCEWEVGGMQKWYKKFTPIFDQVLSFVVVGCMDIFIFISQSRFHVWVMRMHKIVVCFLYLILSLEQMATTKTTTIAAHTNTHTHTHSNRNCYWWVFTEPTYTHALFSLFLSCDGHCTFAFRKQFDYTILTSFFIQFVGVCVFFTRSIHSNQMTITLEFSISIKR